MPSSPSLTHRRDNESGFTLIELLVVVLIIGIIAAIAVPAYFNQQSKANEATMKSDLRNAATAMMNAYVRDGKYPTDGRYLSGGTQTSPAQTEFLSEVRVSANGVATAYYTYADENDRTKTFYGANKAAEGTKPGFCIQESHTTLTGVRYRWLSSENKVEKLPCPGKVWESTPSP